MRLIKRAEEFRFDGEPPIGLGDVVRLNSGGPASLVVDITEASVVVAWRDGGDVVEYRFPTPCVHRVSDLW